MLYSNLVSFFSIQICKVYMDAWEYAVDVCPEVGIDDPECLAAIAEVAARLEVCVCNALDYVLGFVGGVDRPCPTLA